MNSLKTVILLGLMSGILLVGGELVGGQSGLEVGLALAVGMNFFSYFFSDKLADAQVMGDSGSVAKRVCDGKRSAARLGGVY
jgi:hypothetical protein